MRLGPSLLSLLLAGCDTSVLDLGGARGSQGGSGNAGSSGEAMGSEYFDPADGQAVAAGGNATCLRLADGRVKCWGQNDLGQLAVESEHTCDGLPCGDVPITAPALEGSRLIALGSRFGCAIDATSSVSCWGENSFGQLGRGTFDQDAHVEPSPVGIEDATALALGAHHACAATAQGTTYCWGLAEDGRLGVDQSGFESCSDKAACALEPIEVTSFESAVELALGDAHSCARFDDGRVLCVGSNDSGQLGSGDASESLATPIEAISQGAAAIAAGARHTCALTSGLVRCWGSDAAGQLGVGSAQHDTCSGEPCLLAPTRVADISGVEGLGLGARFSCARLDDGLVRCWGDDSRGQIGNSSFAEDSCEDALDGHAFDCQKRPLQEAYDLADVIELRAGAEHACALRAHQLRCWGAADVGQVATHADATFPSVVYSLR